MLRVSTQFHGKSIAVRSIVNNNVNTVKQKKRRLIINCKKESKMEEDEDAERSVIFTQLNQSISTKCVGGFLR